MASHAKSGVTVGVVMDPIADIHIEKDTTIALLAEAQSRGYSLRYMEQADLMLRDGRPHARMRELRVDIAARPWFVFGAESVAPLETCGVILMRKDPPFDLDYLNATYILEAAEARGALVINRAAALRDCNEKLFALAFPQFTPPSLVSAQPDRLRGFLAEHADVVVKPLNQMGGQSVFRLRVGDPNITVILDSITVHGTRLVMAQRFIPEIGAGDKRILVVNGQPVPYALARIPRDGEFRGNLAAGGRGVGQPLSDRDCEIARGVGPELVRRGILFAGLDVIGDYLTEINITSPTCVRELDKAFGLNISAMLLDAIAARLAA
jgi:glutathione synthase